MNHLWTPHTRSSLLEQDKTDKQVTSDMAMNTAVEQDLNGHIPSQKSGCWGAAEWTFGSQKGGRNWGGA